MAKKYIDADKLKFLINEIYPDAKDPRTCGEMDALNKVYDLIDSLQQEQQQVDLEKVVMIDNVIMNMTAEGYNNGYKTRPFYEEVLRRFNAKNSK